MKKWLHNFWVLEKKSTWRRNWLYNYPLRKRNSSRWRRLCSTTLLTKNSALSTMPIKIVSDYLEGGAWKGVYFLLELVTSENVMWTINSISSNWERLVSRGHIWYLFSRLWKLQSSGSLKSKKLIMTLVSGGLVYRSWLFWHKKMSNYLRTEYWSNSRSLAFIY